ncbi:transglycosylase SLT domain-containing protein [Peptoclostridium litorale]|uniref:transglycosylase SLT domain-containing protein n=1 Tax=Peptoclostridium litorale TaxID=1557 RepID=UPI0013564838|nr:transglycosylase SLT domain-containing protein [Peptoclostridium litorale]
MILAPGACLAYENETGDIEIESGYVYFDIDGDGVDDDIFTTAGNAVIYGIEFDIDGDFYRAFSADVTGDGKDEMVVASKERGSSSSLSYKVYSMDDGRADIIFERSGIYRGTLDVEGGALIERIPVYEEGDSNAQPSMTRRDRYIYNGGDFVLQDSKEHRPVSMQSSEGYSNPARSEIEAIIEDVASEKGIPAVILKAIAWTESGMRQFSGGSPLVSFDGVSYGIMQVTPGVHTSYDLNRLKYDIRYNIEAGAAILLEKWGYAFKSSPLIPTIGDGDPRVLENWYFAIWAYNGWSQSNNPNMIPYDHATWVQREAYQDKVLGYAYSQFGQSITPVDDNDLPESGLPDKYANFSTPRPSHSEKFAQYSAGDVIACTAVSGLVLRDDGWNKIGNVSNGYVMAVVKGPQLHGGYIRYNVQVIGDDEGVGWVAMNWAKEAKSGDVDGDGRNTMDDIELIRDRMGFEYDSCDINGSGIVDSQDVAAAFYMVRNYQDANFEKWQESEKTVSENKVWTVRFSDGVDRASAVGGGIYVTDKWGETLDADVEVVGGSSVRINPHSGGYDAGTYRLCIGENLKSSSGRNIGNGTYMEFTVK